MTDEQEPLTEEEIEEGYKLVLARIRLKRIILKSLFIGYIIGLPIGFLACWMLFHWRR